jgi:hypothetical protein
MIEQPPTEIVACDLDGYRHVLEVREDAAGSGLVTVSDDAMTRVMPVTVALELAWQIIRTATRLRRIGRTEPLR